MKQRKHGHALAMAVLGLAVIGGPQSGLAAGAAPAASESAAVLFVADPQIHNMYGVGVKQMTSLADLVSRVAVRPPEVNLLAEHSLTALVAKGLAGDPPKALVVVGDGTNVGCSGEYHEFSAALQAGNPRRVPVLMAHGNHDSYLTGTVNSYMPTEPQGIGDMTGDFIRDASWWRDWRSAERPARGPWKRFAWPNACFRAGFAEPAIAGIDPSLQRLQSLPMSKTRWLAKYVHSLKGQGLTLVYPDALNATTGSASFTSATAPGSALAALNFQLKGVWHHPLIQATGPVDLQRSWKSFVVQAFDTSTTHRMLIIDTSVCENARGGTDFPGTNAGSHGCIGEQQFGVIGELIAATEPGKGISIVGHFPLVEINPPDRDKLLALMAARGITTYISAHTHEPFSERPWSGGMEINIGSTTDWPMQAQKLHFGAGGVVQRRESFSLSECATCSAQTGPVKWPRLVYEENRKGDARSELCRHLPAAEALANLQPEALKTRWRSPARKAECKRSSPRAWKEDADRLDALRAIIRNRMQDPAYRAAAFEVMAAAAEAESRKGQFMDRLP